MLREARCDRRISRFCFFAHLANIIATTIGPAIVNGPRRWLASSQKGSVGKGEESARMSIPDNLHGYHVHIYFNDVTKPKATEVHDSLVAQFGGQPSRPQFTGIAGPHPIAQVQVIFRKGKFTADVVPWLMFNRQSLDILIHPLTDDEVEDHTAHAVWLGRPVALLVEKLKRGRTIPELMPS
jgi:aromatic ring-cleaving dioxygenase